MNDLYTRWSNWTEKEIDDLIEKYDSEEIDEDEYLYQLEKLSNYDDFLDKYHDKNRED